ncbi:MAG TPA: thiamine pyrophosphate-binding protein [Streptosporangiaceae bacterium]|jgi:benzoylformate decarboxylase
MSMSERVADRFLALLRDEGVDRVFGNPGTTEVPMIEALSGARDITYTLGIQEQAVVAMADGHARTTGRPSFVNLHAGGGLSNGLIGMLNALRSRTPMVVTAGQQDQRHLAYGPMLSADLVGLAQTAAKSAEQVHRAEDLPIVMRRAFALARTAPYGPVFVSIPSELFGQDATVGTPARTPRPGLGTADGIERAAAVLAAAERPAIIAGDRVGQGGAVAELTAVAEALGALVVPQPMFDAVNADSEHPLTAPMPLPLHAKVREVLDGHDVVLVAGATIRPHGYTPGSALPDGARVVQIDTDASEIGRNWPAEVGLLGELAPTLAALAEELRGSGPNAARLAERAGERASEIGGRQVAERDAWRAAARSRGSDVPGSLHPLAAAQLVADAIPDGATVVEEAITTGKLLRRALRMRKPGDFHHTVGGGLGWGIGTAVGARLARADRPVVALLGDGAAMFGVQGLWSAGHYGAPVTFVVFNNAEYRSPRQDGPGIDPEKLVGVDLTEPSIDWSHIAAGFGMNTVRVTRTDDVAPVIADATRADAPVLVEIPILGFVSERAQDRAGR